LGLGGTFEGNIYDWQEHYDLSKNVKSNGSPGLNSKSINDYVKKPKASDISTPRFLSQFIYDKIKDIPNFNKEGIILDICCKEGALSLPFKESGYEVIGIDNKDYSKEFHSQFIQCDFLEQIKSIKDLPIRKPELILINPPWNNPKRLYEKAYLPALFLKHIFKIFGKDIKLVLLTSYTLLENTTIHSDGKVSDRYRYLESISEHITGILEQPLNSFKGVKLWNNTIFFNIENINPVMFIPQIYFDKYL